MSLVIDASVVAAMALPDEDREYAQAAFNTLMVDGGLAPWVLWYEVRNSLLQAERRGRLSESSSASFLERFASLPISFEASHISEKTMSLGREHTLSLYDASYLELSLRSGMAIATQGRALKKAVLKEGGTLFST